MKVNDVAVCLLLCWSAAGPAQDELYPLSPEMALLERDTKSAEYRAGLPEMLVTDLAAEWQRAVNPDDADSFAKRQGGFEKVKQDPKLRAAHARRARIVADFLELMRAEYARRKQKAPFDQGQQALAVPMGTGRSDQGVKIEPVHPSAAAAGQWYRWRGADGQGNTSEAQPPLRWSESENVVWKVPIPGLGNSSPVIWNDRIFLTSSNEKGTVRSVLCFDRSDGELLWKQDVALERLERMVRDKNGHASSTPVVDGERVISFLGNGGMAAYDFAGKFLWRTDLGSFDGMWGPGASPLLWRDLVLLVQDQNQPYSLSVALEKTTGKVRWRVERERAMGWATPVVLRVNGRDEMIYMSNKRVVACDPETGQELWWCHGPTHEPIPSIVAGLGMVFCTSGRNGPTLAVRPGGSGDVTKTHLVWSALRGGPHVPSPLLLDELIYLVNDRGILTCLEATTGSTIYQKRLEGKFSASPVSAGGYVFLTSEEGATYVLRAGRSFDVVAVNRLGQPLLASLALVAGKIYARAPSMLFCIAER